MLKLLEESDQYLAETRCTIWELRSPLLQKSGDFATVLAKVSQRAQESIDIRLSKLEVLDRTQAVVAAAQRGFIELGLHENRRDCPSPMA
jgi:hypothetical protein